MFTALLLGLCLAAHSPIGSSVRCYSCNWFQPIPANMTACTEERFDPAALPVSECVNGCEIFMHWNELGVLEHIRRNCSDRKTEPRGRCEMMSPPDIPYFKGKRCTCGHELCNSAPERSLFFGLALSLSFTLLALYRSAHHC